MHFSRIAVFLFLVLSLINVSTALEEKSKMRSVLDKITVGWGSGLTSRDGCIWKGTSPFCAGGCDVLGHVVRETSAFGDGKTCLTGIKGLCCPSP